ncbi:MAG: pantothenate kinase [Chloroflexi bacterium]|nr:pantothenate kinase [Chloroflexota bacterium]
MIICIDIGNTTISLGMFTSGTHALDSTPSARWTIATDAGRTADEYLYILKQLLEIKNIKLSDIKDVAICSVVPRLTSVFSEMFKSYFGLEALVVGPGVKTGIRILYENTRDVGADRIVDASAAVNIYGSPVIVVDFGTATVFDAVSIDNEYLGGAIVPGVEVALNALYHNTSQLKRVELNKPPSAIGKNTENAIQSGVILGCVDLVNGMVARFKSELGSKPKVIGTGGLVTVIAKETNIFDDINLDSTLMGLRQILASNR